MKRFFLAALLLAAVTTSVFADGSKAGKMLNDLKASLKNLNASAWTTTDFYRKTTFNFNGRSATAYVNDETGNLIGFGISISQDALPEGTKENLEKKYEGWKVASSAMFIDSYGEITYYTQVTNGNKNLMLKVYPKGRLGIYARM